MSTASGANRVQAGRSCWSCANKLAASVPPQASPYSTAAGRGFTPLAASWLASTRSRLCLGRAAPSSGVHRAARCCSLRLVRLRLPHACTANCSDTKARPSCPRPPRDAWPPRARLPQSRAPATPVCETRQPQCVRHRLTDSGSPNPPA